MQHQDDNELIRLAGKSWLRLEMVSKEPVPDNQLPFSRGNLIQIKNSPRPDKIPNGSIAMFIDYNWSTYKMLRTGNDLQPTEHTKTFVNQFVNLVDIEMEPPQEHNEVFEHRVQYQMKVLFDEKVIDFFNIKPEDLNENYVKIEDSKAASRTS